MKGKLYNVAKHYLEIIEQMERTSDAHMLAQLEEQRVLYHNKLIDILGPKGIPYKDREHVTRLAYQLVRMTE